VNELEKEIHKCQSSIAYFLSQHCHIQHPSAGIIPFNPFKYQLNALSQFDSHRFNIVRKCRQCFAGNSPIWGPDGPKFIKDIKPGDLVYSLNQNTGLIEAVPVLELYENEEQELYEVRSKTGHRSNCTQDHQFLTHESEFVEAADLNKDDRLVEIHDQERQFSNDPSDDEIKLLAYLITDGSCGRWISFNNSEWSYLLEYQRCWNRVFDNRVRIRQHESGFKSDSDINYRIQSGLKRAKEWAAEFNILGRTFGDKIIPKQVFSWSNKAIALFINRMFAADGWYSGSHCNEAGIGQESPIILYQLKQLLTRFGINSKFYPKSESSIPKLRIFGGRDFELFVDRIDIYKKKPRCPITKGFFRDRQRGEFKSFERTFVSEKTYDLRVPPHDNYIVDGAVVHNCGISQISGAYALHQGMFFPYQTILIISKKEDDAKGFLRRNITFLFDNLPEWMQKLWEPEKRNEHEIIFPNGTSIKSLTSSPEVLRSHSASLNIIDEAAFIPSMDRMWASGYSCVVAETLLTTDTGLIRMDSLVSGKERWQDIDIKVQTDEEILPADKVYLSGTGPVRKITTDLGLELTTTPNHRFRVIDPNGEYVWRYMNDASPGEYIVVRLGDTPEIKKVNPELYLAGILFSRGHVVGKQIHTKFNSQLQTTEFIDVLTEYFGQDGFVINKRQLKVSSPKAFELAEKYGISLTTEPTERRISDEILELGRDNYYHVLCGIIDSQSASGKRIGAIFDSQELVRDIQNIMFDFGFPISVSQTSAGHHRLIIVDSDLGNTFSEHFYSTRHDLRLCAESGQSYNTDHPVLVHLFEAECNTLIRENPGDEEITRCGSYGRIRYNDINGLLKHEVGDINSWLVKNKLFVDKIVKVEEDIRETFDIQVPEKHCYVSNSLVSHNTLQHGGRVIVVSTLNGMGDWYYKMLKGAEQNANGFNLITINWYDMDWEIEYKDKGTNEQVRIAPCDGIRECVTSEEREKYGPYWSPWLQKQYNALAEEGETWKFDQEILARVVSSGKTVLPALNLDAIDEMVRKPLKIAKGIQQYMHPIRREPIQLDFDFEGNQGLWFWEMPVRQHPDAPQGYTYTMGVDTMTGRGNDFHALEVFCLETGEQVAEMMMRCIPKMLCPYVDMLGRFYNNALVNVERNNGGDGVIDELRLEYGYPNLWRRIRIPDKAGVKPKLDPYGHFTTDISKIGLNKMMINLLGRPECVKVYSSRLHDQLCTYINHRDRGGRPTGKTGAEVGCHDDLCLGAGLGLVALVSNPDPNKSKVLPFKIDQDIAFATTTPDETIIAYDQNLVSPVSVDHDEPNGPESTSYEDQVAGFARDLWLGDRKKVEAPVVKRKSYYGK